MGKKRKSIATSLDEVDRTMYASFCSAANSLSHLYTQTMNQQKLSFQAGKRHGLNKCSCRYVVHLAKSGTDRLRMLISHVLANCNDSAGKMLESMNQIRFSSLFKDKLRKNLSVDLETTRGRIKSYNNGYPQLPSDSKGWFALLKCGDLLVILSARNELDYGEEPSMSPRAPSQQQHSQPAMQFMNTGFMVSTGSSGQTAVQGTRPDHCDQQSKNLVFSNALSSPVRRSLQHYHIAQEGYCPNGGLPSGNGARSNEPSFLQNQTRDSNPLSSNDSSMDMHADSPSHESAY
ncbi:hypothetical protein Goshw_014000 [Gossypium schwendimanii]|uniref:Uncharacterized protein n=1 Tax=Gossypium schwendimanii TaxID=34291 RepID=A0A7J9M3S2_GOSSC|nr:hypothetical protein [Gossypium schwendimanii]